MSEVFESRFFRTDESQRQYGKVCPNCSFYEVCQGVYTGYETKQLEPISTTVPNFFYLYQVAELKKQKCLLDTAPSYVKLPFKRVAVEHDGLIPHLL